MARRARAIELETHEVPKLGGVRVLTTLGPKDADAYARVVSVLAPRILALRDPGVHGGELAARDLAAARAGWRRDVEVVTATGVAVRSDVRACYPSIGPVAVQAALLASGAHPHDVERLRVFLERVRRAGAPGLPVGPAPSAIVADAVLALGDRSVRRTGGSIVRWVDDVVIAGPDRPTALRAFDAWIRSLRGLGLEPHDGKTAVLDDTGAVPEGGPSGWRAPSRGMMRAP